MNKTNDVNTIMGRLNALNTEATERKYELDAMNYSKLFWEVSRGNMPKNAFKEGQDGSGGHLVPDEFERKLILVLEEENVLRKLGKVITTKHDLKIPTVEGHGAAAWVLEGEHINDSDDTFGQIVLKAYKLATMTIISEELLEDSEFDLETYIAKEFSRRIGKREEEDFLLGDGVHKPYGLINDAPIGAITAQSGILSLDDAIDLMYSVDLRYHNNSVWLMSNDAFRVLYKCRSSFGRNIWRPSLVEGEPETLLGRPVIVSESMPNVESGSKPILFGDFSYYLIGDRGKRSL